jgi:hypothetical protein
MVCWEIDCPVFSWDKRACDPWAVFDLKMKETRKRNQMKEWINQDQTGGILSKVTVLIDRSWKKVRE